MLAKESYQQGIDTINQLFGAGGEEYVKKITSLSPELAEWMISLGFGEVYSRPQFDLKQRQLLTITCLVMLGDCDRQLTVQVNNALNIGLSPQEIIEALLHCVIFAGFIRVVNAMVVVKQVLKERSSSPSN